MAYWWRRRRWRRPRRGRWRRNYRRWRRRTRRGYRARKRYGRRRARRGRRGRGRRRRKVRYLNFFKRTRARVLRQWEPNSKTFCKITGHEQGLFWGRQAQFRVMCDNLPWPIKTAEWEGGAMNLLQHTLFFLYNDNLLGKNNWSRSNAGYDLCRYHGTRFWFPRHPSITYAVIISREGHFYLDETTYPNLHPESMLHAKKKLVIYSKIVKPKGKNFIRVRVPPPQLLKTQWFFQRDFCKIPLFTLLISAMDPIDNIITGGQFNSSTLLFGFPYYSRPMPYDTYADYVAKCWGPQTEPWQQRGTNNYGDFTYLKKKTNGNGGMETQTQQGNDWKLDCAPLLGIHFGLRNTSYLCDYDKATKAILDPAVKAVAISFGRWSAAWPADWSTKDNINTQQPFSYRYHWNQDLGKGNKIILYTRECRNSVPEADQKLEDQPLYKLANGYYDYTTKHSLHNPLNWVMVVWCPYTKPPMEGVIPVNKDWFKLTLTHGANKYRDCTNGQEWIRGWCKANGNAQCLQQTTKYKTVNGTQQKLLQGCIIRAPDFLDSEEFFKNLYQASPFTMKQANTPGNIWFTYQSLWSWGGDFQKQKPIEDPCRKPKWGTIPISNYDERGVQIQNPETTKPDAMLHTWDVRRGQITGRALKRLMRIDSTDSDPEPDHSPQRKRRRPKEPLTAQEVTKPEDVYLYLSSPEKPKISSDGKSPKTKFTETHTDCKKLAEQLWEALQENRFHRHHLRKYLRKQRDGMDRYRLLLG
nr:ORF1 [Epsilontorquevirus sp.]